MNWGSLYNAFEEGSGFIILHLLVILIGILAHENSKIIFRIQKNLIGVYYFILFLLLAFGSMFTRGINMREYVYIIHIFMIAGIFLVIISLRLQPRKTAITLLLNTIQLATGLILSLIGAMAITHDWF